MNSKKNLVRFMLVALIAMLWVSTAVVAQNSDFTGTWKLNGSKSSLSYDFSLAPRQLNIVQKELSMSMERFTEMMGQSLNYTDHYALDGTQNLHEGLDGVQRKSVVTWNENRTELQIVTIVPTNEFGEVTITELLSMEGNSMTVKSHAATAMGDLFEIFVFDRE